MTKDEAYNMMINRFEEAAQTHSIIHLLEFRFKNEPFLPILVKMMENHRDEILALGVQEYLGIQQK